jgi:hypothetical protein
MRSGMSANLVQFAALGLLTLAVSPAIAGGGPFEGRVGTPIAPILLLVRSDVRAELRLDETQAADLERAIADLQAKAMPLRGRNDAESNRARAEIDRASRRWLVEHLSDAQQTRLAQLDLQWEGPSALLTRPIVAESIRLSDDQRARLGRAIDERNTKRKGGPAVATDEVALFRATLAILTDDQKANWRAMLGPIAPFQAALHPLRDGTVIR